MSRYWKFPPRWLTALVLTQIVVQVLFAAFTVGVGKDMPWICFILIAAFAGWYAGSGIARALRERDAIPSFLKPPTEPLTYCGDCGKKNIAFETQRGFDRKTGKPRMNSILACPDWLTGGRRKPLSPFDVDDYYECGNTAVGKPVIAHIHDEGGIDPDCPGCVAAWAS